MMADPDGSGMGYCRVGADNEQCRTTPVASAGWRGPGWRAFDACSCCSKEVRDWITGVVARHGCSADPGDAALVVSELFANALIHGPAGGRVLVGYCLWPGGARIVVCDAGGATSPGLRDPGVLEEGGRGLQVVDAVTAAWGSFSVGYARAVWCDLGRPLDGPADGDAWAWLRAVLATVAIAATTAAVPAGDSPAKANSGRRRPSRWHEMGRLSQRR